jgi:DNA-binding LytR/AlgR family response regulator
MINVIIYKEGVSLINEFSNRPLSISERHTLFFCSSYDQILHQISNDQADLIMYFTNIVNSEDVLRLRRLSETAPNSKLNLFSDANYALQAWHLDMFHFDNHPIDLDKVKRAFHKYLKNLQTAKHNVLTLKLTDGTHNIPLKDIRFLLASGNYTFIHYEADKNLLITKQIGQFDFLNEKNSLFHRIHRSLIINIGNIKSVDGSSVHFYNCEKPLNVSASLAQKIKKLLNSK